MDKKDDEPTLTEASLQLRDALRVVIHDVFAPYLHYCLDALVGEHGLTPMVFAWCVFGGTGLFVIIMLVIGLLR